MKRHVNLWLFLGVILLTLLPFVFVSPSSDNAFEGADGKAMALIKTISPGYRPWFTPLFEPSSSEIASLLFSLEAALGAGIIGYYLGAANAREKMRRNETRAPSNPPVDTDLSRAKTEAPSSEHDQGKSC